MIDRITTLHPKDDLSIDLYPNIKPENIPDKSITADKLTGIMLEDVSVEDGKITIIVSK